jgi:hypothetical protein
MNYLAIVRRVAGVFVCRRVVLCGLMLAGFACVANAVPITYRLIIMPNFSSNLGPAGTLGSVPFGGVGAVGGICTGTGCSNVLTFTFEGDTANVVPFSITSPRPTSGFEILVGTASVRVTDAFTGVLVAQGTFQPSAGIFISIDNSNGGVGFGSFVISNPSDPKFPGQPVYPYAMSGMLVANAGLLTYDLRSNFFLGPTPLRQFGVSCVGFPGTCATPLALATDAGNLLVNAMPSGMSAPPIAIFSAETHAAAGAAPLPPTNLGVTTR